MDQKKTNILITGASSGIGESLAFKYAGPDVCLFLTGRNAKRLEEVCKNCISKGAEVFSEIIDVQDNQAMVNWLTDIDKKWPIDIVIANAGIGSFKEEVDYEVFDQMVKTNLYGVWNTIEPIIPGMKKRKSGKIAIMSSMGAFYSMPRRSVYSMTKIAIRYLGDDWRRELRDYNVSVTVIHPGFIDTPFLTRRTNPRPFLMSVEKAARIMVTGISKGKAQVIFPRVTYYPLLLLSYLPVAVSDFLARKLLRY